MARRAGEGRRHRVACQFVFSTGCAENKPHSPPTNPGSFAPGACHPWRLSFLVAFWCDAHPPWDVGKPRESGPASGRRTEVHRRQPGRLCATTKREARRWFASLAPFRGCPAGVLRASRSSCPAQVWRS